jgi:hypothetical protein
LCNLSWDHPRGAAVAGGTRVPPVRIELDDYGTRQGLTELRRGDAWLSGLYLSFDIWQQLFRFDDGSWLAAVDGPFHDNLVAISVGPELKDARAPRPFVLSAQAAEAGNVSPRAATAGFLALDAATLARLGFSRYDQVHWAPERGIRRYLHLHDDFMFVLQPLDEPLLRRALQLVAGVHEHYLGVSLSAAQNDHLAGLIEQALNLCGTLELRSRPERRTIAVSHRLRARSRWRRLLGLTDKVCREIAIPAPS